MNPRLNFILALPLYAALLSPLPAQAKDYDEVVTSCTENIAPDKLSPQKAEECIKDFHDDPSILERFREEKPTEAGEVLAYNSALKDYKKVIVSYKDLALAQQLDRIINKTACPVCDLGLGPQPEDSFDWVGKYLPQDLRDFRYSVRTWDDLGPVRTPALSADGHTKGGWNAQGVMDRYRSLVVWSRYVVSQTTSVPVAMYPDKAKLAQLVPILKEDVYSEPIKAALDNYLSGSGVTPVKTGPSAASTAAQNKISKTSSDAAALKGMSTGAQAGALDNFFNGTGHHPAGDFTERKGASSGAKKPYVYTPLSPTDISNLGPRLLQQGKDGTLSGPLANQIKGTKAGDEILAFYKDKGYQGAGTNKLAFGFEPMRKGLFGGWNWVNEDINLNSELANDWMKKNKVTPAMLMQGDPAKNKHLRGLSEYLAPTFVHEATHQRQTAKDKRDGIDLFKYAGKSNSYYQMEKETEAFSMDASFTAQKYAQIKDKKAREAYLDRLDPFDKSNMKVYQKQGVDGIRLSNHKSYSDKESLDGHASKEFVMAKNTSMRLEALQTRAAQDPSSLTPDERTELQDLRQQMGSKFKWYTITMRDSVAAETKMNGWRQDILKQISGKRTIKENPVPTLLSP